MLNYITNMDKRYASKAQLYLRFDCEESYKVFSPPRSLSRNGCKYVKGCFGDLSFCGSPLVERSCSRAGARNSTTMSKLLSCPLPEHRRLKKKLKENATKSACKAANIKKNYESFGVRINKCRLINSRTANSSERILRRELHIYVRPVLHHDIFTKSVGINTEESIPNEPQAGNKAAQTVVEKEKVLHRGKSERRKPQTAGQRPRTRYSYRNLQRSKPVSKYSIRQVTTLMSLNNSAGHSPKKHNKHLWPPLMKLSEINL
eukprot:TRINITY_DN3964_c0_g2_i4.p1 TRINITY_DN3964_c0_g2~~TRINITY_DN3964_c0_g2_i4.p1  ORF type:complete len:260 (+),score=14.77 TRINITY_DN3964_c0_g2_i4:125-904(+)